MLSFLLFAMGDLWWHPSISLVRMQLASCEAALGRIDEAARLVEQAVLALMVTHGEQHMLTQRALALQNGL